MRKFKEYHKVKFLSLTLICMVIGGILLGLTNRLLNIDLFNFYSGIFGYIFISIIVLFTQFVLRKYDNWLISK
jgi:uncharacterized membrane protein YvlD (DUF360 family)